jgi:hypothetical protein
MMTGNKKYGSCIGIHHQHTILGILLESSAEGFVVLY